MFWWFSFYKINIDCKNVFFFNLASIFDCLFLNNFFFGHQYWTVYLKKNLVGHFSPLYTKENWKIRTFTRVGQPKNQIVRGLRRTLTLFLALSSFAGDFELRIHFAPAQNWKVIVIFPEKISKDKILRLSKGVLLFQGE